MKAPGAPGGQSARNAIVFALVAGAMLAGCTSAAPDRTARIEPEITQSAAALQNISPIGATAGAGAGYHVGEPYKIAGVVYEPKENPGYQAVGLASWYGSRFHGRKTANGEVFDLTELTAAHPTLPLPSYVRVTNLANERSVIVRVNDRGPFTKKRVLDVSQRTAELLGFKAAGTAKVHVAFVDRAPLQGDDNGVLLASYKEGAAAPSPVLVAYAGSSRLPGARPGAPSPQPVGGAGMPFDPYQALLSGNPESGKAARLFNAAAVRRAEPSTSMRSSYAHSPKARIAEVFRAIDMVERR